MFILNKEAFLNQKKSKTIVVYGSGYSINKLNSKDKKILSSFDSISFNWFCKSNIPTTYYIVREQCSTKKRISKGETLDIFYKSLNARHKKSCSIVHRFTYDKKYKLYDHSKNLKRIKGSGIVVDDIYKLSNVIKKNPKAIIRKFTEDIFEHGVQHGLCTLYSVMHIVTFCGYKKIVFAGIDLNDSRYFWLKKDEPRYTLVKDNKGVTDKHKVRYTTMKLLSLYQKVFPKKKLCVYNKASALTKIMGQF